MAHASRLLTSSLAVAAGALGSGCRASQGSFASAARRPRAKALRADQVLIRGTGAKFVAGFCGVHLHVCRWSRGREETHLTPKLASWLRLPRLGATCVQSNCPITGNNGFLTLGSEDIHAAKDGFLNAAALPPPHKEERERNRMGLKTTTQRIPNINAVSGEKVFP